jgi:hypothetical protein
VLAEVAKMKAANSPKMARMETQKKQQRQLKQRLSITSYVQLRSKP